MRAIAWGPFSLAVFTAACAAPPPTVPTAPPVRAASPALAPVDLAVRDVRLFDGAHVVEHATVEVRGGKIVAVRVGASPAESAPASVVVEGAGKTLLPGLVDAHVHVFDRGSLVQSLAFGVTMALDQFSTPDLDARMRDEQAKGKADDRADLRSAGILVTAPGGHGTEYGVPIPTLGPKDDPQAFVDARIAEGSDWIKIVYDDGRSFGAHIPTLTRDQLAKVIAAAHARGKLAVVHVTAAEQGVEAIEAGADGLAHLFGDAPAPAGFAESAAAHHAFVIPTLAVAASAAGDTTAKALAKDPAFAPWLTRDAAQSLTEPFDLHEHQAEGAFAQSIAALRAAHVPILAGTDAPNPGTTYGVSLHDELARLVDAGLSPVDALVSATSAPAACFHLDGRGAVQPGMIADLVLVDGDPTRDIHATRAIVGVWKGGVRFDRDAYRAAAEKDRAAPAPNIPSASGLVSDFDGGSLAARFGAGWQESTDALIGGKSTVHLAAASPGAHGSPGALRVDGDVGPGLAYAWAGAMFWAGAAPMQPVDASKAKELVFWTKGDAGTYRAMLFAPSHGRMPMTQTFDVSSTWKEVRLPIASFQGFDGKDLSGVLFSGGPRAGKFTLWIDDVELR